MALRLILLRNTLNYKGSISGLSRITKAGLLLMLLRLVGDYLHTLINWA